MTSPDTELGPGMFARQKVSEFCNSIKDIHRLLSSVSAFFIELDRAEAPSGNGLPIDFKKWGIRTITEDLLARQYRKINRIVVIYKEEHEKMKGVYVGK